MGWLGRLLTVLLVLAVSAVDDDLEFEMDASPTPPLSSTAAPVRRHWGVPDSQAVAGKLFVARIPADAFSGDVDFYETVAVRGKPWPSWLDMNRNGLMKGVPSSDDVGVHFLMVRAVGPHAQHSSRDVFAVEVIKPGLDGVMPQSTRKEHCSSGVDPMMLSILMDLEVKEIEPRQRVTIIETIASYFSLPQELFYLRGLTTPRDLLSLADATVVIAGPGNVITAKDKDFASLSFQIGCGRAVRKEMKPVIERIRSDAKDGTLAEVLQLPVVGWHARNELPAFFRDRREVGSGDFYEEDDDEDDYGESLTTLPPTLHPHRHHHGEDGDVNAIDGLPEPEVGILEPSEVFYHRPSDSLLVNYENIISTPAFIPERPTVGPDMTTTVLPTRVTEIDLTSSSVSPHLVNSETDRSSNQPVTVPLLPTNDGNNTELSSEGTSDTPTQPISTSGSSSSSSSSQPTESETTPELVTTDSLSTSSSVNHSSNAVAGTTTEEMEPETRNFPPTILHRLKKVAVVAGKVLRFKIPENTFNDIEDGTTSHMDMSFTPIDIDGHPLKPTDWITFNDTTREIIALPLEKHVSKWEFRVTATDKDRDSVSDTFELQVQQHKGTRTVNHEITMSLSIQKGFEYPLDWQLRTLDALTHVFGDSDSSHITVRAASVAGDPVSFTWTNDSLPKSPCPREDILRLMKVLTVSEDGFPSSALQKALGSNIIVRHVSWQGIENCETKVLTQPPPPEVPSQNFAPVPRNQIDQVNATVGRLLLFRVPEDTFYDPEDGGTRKLKMSLLNMDRSPLGKDHWLQFDSKNQEFYGLPMDSDVGSQEYQLVCEDRAGLSANDGLIVYVRPRGPRNYNVEFNIALDVPYENFTTSASMKRKFVEKIKELFGDATPDSIVLTTIERGSTQIRWFNQSLPTEYCPGEVIQPLRRILVDDNEIMSDRLVSVMGTEFPVISVGLAPSGVCLGELTVTHHDEVPPPPPIDESHPISGTSEDYLITFVIPIIIIALMLILAGLVACLFYRKRRASKMGIGDEDERQSFRSKGIPVIFQDELEEKPEAENKNPVIMKEEKPPLPPPEYQHDPDVRSQEDTPYHPPPPFSRDSGRNSRPKPTPTYRKPPPYVPP